MSDPLTEIRALMIFHDDSSLAVARSFADLLAKRGASVRFMHFISHAGRTAKLSPRQLAQGLGPWRVERTAIGMQACDESYLADFSLIASAKFPILFRKLWTSRGWRFGKTRPRFLALFPGLELTAGRGYEIRRHADIICLPTRRDVENYVSSVVPGRPHDQCVFRFHPRLLRRKPAGLSGRPRVVFFTQSVAPATLAGRLYMARLLVETARANPDVELVIKLRHRRDENRTHTHVERFDYETLLRKLEPGPNLRISDESADEALAGASMALTCSSTSGLEALAYGVPTMFFLDYAEADADPLNAPMRVLLGGGGPLASRDQVLTLTPPPASAAWLEEMLSDKLDLEAVLDAAASPAAPSQMLGGNRIGRGLVTLDALMKRALRP